MQMSGPNPFVVGYSIWVFWVLCRWKLSQSCRGAKKKQYIINDIFYFDVNCLFVRSCFQLWFKEESNPFA